LSCGATLIEKAQSAIVWPLIGVLVRFVANDPLTRTALLVFLVLAVVPDVVWKWVRDARREPVS
jgi:hypothetical protein